MAVKPYLGKINNTQLNENNLLLFIKIVTSFAVRSIVPLPIARAWIRNSFLSNVECVEYYIEELETGGDAHSVPAGYDLELPYGTIEYIAADNKIFHHSFDGTPGASPSLTDETGKALSVVSNSLQLGDANPSPVGGTYLTIKPGDPGGLETTIKQSDLNFTGSDFKISLQFKSRSVSVGIGSFLLINDDPTGTRSGGGLSLQLEGLTASTSKIVARWYDKDYVNDFTLETPSFDNHVWHTIGFERVGTTYNLILNHEIEDTELNPTISAQVGDQHLHIFLGATSGHLFDLDHVSIK